MTAAASSRAPFLGWHPWLLHQRRLGVRVEMVSEPRLVAALPHALRAPPAPAAAAAAAFLSQGIRPRWRHPLVAA
jgi:hypothetical protein